MRAARFFLCLTSAVWLAASSAAQTANILYNFTDFQHQLANVSQVAIVPMMTNGSANGALLSQYFRPYTRANTPSLASGTFLLTNVVPGVVYRTTFLARGGGSTYDILVPMDTPDGATIGAWTNVVNIQNGIFLSYLPNVPGAQPGYVPVAVDTSGHYNWTNAVFGGGAATNVYQSQRGNNLITISTNTGTLTYTFSGVDQTNGYPWSPLYDPANSALAVQTSLIAAQAGIQAQFVGSNTVYRAAFPAEAIYEAMTNALATSAFGNASGLNSGTVASARLGTGSASSSTFLRGDGQWATPAGSGNVNGPATATDATFAFFMGTTGTQLTNRNVTGTFGPASFDTAGAGNSAATLATNAMSVSGSPLMAFHNTNEFGVMPAVPATGHTNVLMQKIDGSLIGYDLAALLGIVGSGSVTSVGLSAPGDITISGSPVTGSGTLSWARTAGATANFVGQNATNIATAAITNTAIVGGISTDPTNQFQVNTRAMAKAVEIGTNAFTYFHAPIYAPNLFDGTALLASHHVSTGATTNFISSEDGTGFTNLVAYTHEGTGTNLNIAFNGTQQTFTVTNGPDVWLNWSGANGVATFQFTTNVSIHSSTTFSKFLAGSNGVSSGVYKITNGLFSVGSFGGTNSVQLVPAIGENQ